MTKLARTTLTTIIGAAALSLMPGAVHAQGLIGSTVNFGFYVSGNFVVDATGNTIDPNGDPAVLYQIDQFYQNVPVTAGSWFTFSDAAVGQGINGPYPRVTFTGTGITSRKVASAWR